MAEPAGLLGFWGQAAGEGAQPSQHIVSVDFAWLFLESRFGKLWQPPPV